MKAHRRAILGACDDRYLELARQIAELGVETAPLAQQFGPGARVRYFIGGSAGKLVRGNVADAIAAGLDRMHLDRGEVGQNVRRVFELDPVILKVLPRGEMAIIAIIFACDVREHPHLPAVERAIGNGDAQHIGVELEIEAVHQPQGLELVLAHFAGQAALHLVAEFRDARIDDRLVVSVIFVHVRSPTGRCRDRRAST